MRTLTGTDKATLVFGIILFSLSIISFSLTGVLDSSNPWGSYIYSVHFGVATWYLICAIVCIISGVMGHKAAYITLIVLTVIGILSALGGITVAIVGFVTGFFYSTSSYIGYNSYNGYRTYSYKYIYNTVDDILYGTRDAFGMSIGLVVIDSLSFIFLIVVSCIACCGTCNNHQQSSTTTTTVIHGQAPGYVSYPPQPAYAAQGGYTGPAAYPQGAYPQGAYAPPAPAGQAYQPHTDLPMQDYSQKSS